MSPRKLQKLLDEEEALESERDEDDKAALGDVLRSSRSFEDHREGAEGGDILARLTAARHATKKSLRITLDEAILWLKQKLGKPDGSLKGMIKKVGPVDPDTLAGFICEWALDEGRYTREMGALAEEARGNIRRLDAHGALLQEQQILDAEGRGEQVL